MRSLRFMWSHAGQAPGHTSLWSGCEKHWWCHLGPWPRADYQLHWTFIPLQIFDFWNGKMGVQEAAACCGVTLETVGTKHDVPVWERRCSQKWWNLLLCFGGNQGWSFIANIGPCYDLMQTSATTTIWSFAITALLVLMVTLVKIFQRGQCGLRQWMRPVPGTRIVRLHWPRFHTRWTVSTYPT